MIHGKSSDFIAQIIGMREAGMSLRQIAQRVGHHHSIVSRIVNKHRLTNDV
jgi:IS30 family transposase